MEAENETRSGPPEGDFTALQDGKEHEQYFKQLRRVLGHLEDCYPEKDDKGQSEGAVTRSYIQRLAYTMELLQKKYLFRDPNDRPLFVDITESGFPNHMELSELDVDLARRETLLRELPPVSILKRMLADELFRLQAEPLEVLRQLSKRVYLEALQPEKMFSQFVGGRLTRIGESGEFRRYTYSFGCYDFVTNRPFLHFLTFDQDMSEPRLESPGSHLEQVLNAIRTEGSRAPEIGILAMSIDDALESIHPKVLKRIGLGPLYSRVLLQNREANRDDPREAYVQELMRKFSRREDDFVLLIHEEVIFSKRQDVSRGMFSPKGRVREVFAVTETDPECNARKASAVNHYFLMPHELLQHVEPRTGVKITDFTRATKLTIDETGEIHGL